MLDLLYLGIGKYCYFETNFFYFTKIVFHCSFELKEQIKL